MIVDEKQQTKVPSPTADLLQPTTERVLNSRESIWTRVEKKVKFRRFFGRPSRKTRVSLAPKG